MPRIIFTGQFGALEAVALLDVVRNALRTKPYADHVVTQHDRSSVMDLAGHQKPRFTIQGDNRALCAEVADTLEPLGFPIDILLVDHHISASPPSVELQDVIQTLKQLRAACATEEDHPEDIEAVLDCVHELKVGIIVRETRSYKVGEYVLYLGPYDDIFGLGGVQKVRILYRGGSGMLNPRSVSQEKQEEGEYWDEHDSSPDAIMHLPTYNLLVT